MARRADDDLIGDHETDPGAGKYRLGERAEIDDPLVGVQRLQRRDVQVVEPEQPVRIVLENQQILIGRHLDQPAPDVSGQRDA